MTDDIVGRARAVLEGTTEGPWHVDADGDIVCAQGRVASPYYPDNFDKWPTWEQRTQDAWFMALSRQLVPEMAAEIEQLRASSFTAADLARAWAAGRDAGAVEAQGEGWPDLKTTGPSERQEAWWDCGDAIADSIRTLTPPADLAEKVKEARG